VLIEHLRAHPRVDAGVFLVIDPAGERMEPPTGWFGSPGLREALEAALDRPYDRSRPGLAEASLERGRPLFLPKLEAWESAPLLKRQIEARVYPARAARAWNTLRRASVIGCPVRTTLGRPMGVLIVACADPARALRRTDLDAVKVLAALAALAQERFDLLSSEAGRARDELLLKRAAEGTAGSLEIRDVEIQAVEHSLRLVDADHAALTRTGERSSRLATTASTGVALPAGHTALDPGALSEVMRSQRTMRLEHAPYTVHVPVRLGRRLFGVLSVIRIAGPAFDSREVELIQALARMAAAAIANALDFDRERRVAQALTRGFVPASPPEVPGCEIGFLYEPAEEQVAGGDLYGSWRLPGGEVAVLVGDVAGKGVRTAALSAMARFFIEARSWDSTDPAQTLAQAGTMLSTRLPDDTFVTASFGLLDTDGLLRYANAGHLRPLVLRAGGELNELGGAGLPLGISSSPEYENHELRLGPGDLVLGFTDGLVEARRGSELLGDERLQGIVRAAAGRADDVQELVRLIHHDVREWSDGLGDDVVLLGLERRAVPPVEVPL
jgi:serine phosphatase RsbU (regulator of sigma subunit)